MNRLRKSLYISYRNNKVVTAKNENMEHGQIGQWNCIWQVLKGKQ